jgi:putative hydrolase of the HAD superfamily
MPEIRAVLFDYGLVLSGPPDPLAWGRMQTVLNVADPDFHDAYWRHRHDYDLGVLDAYKYWHTVAADVGRSLTSTELDALLAADVDLWTQPNQPMIDWAQSLQSAGTRTAILSNMPEAVENGILRRFPWMAQFTHHTFSHRLGIAKPDERIYSHAISAVAVAPEEALFIDDRIENIEAARALGIHAIQYVSHDAFLRELESRRFSGLLLPEQLTS